MAGRRSKKERSMRVRQRVSRGVTAASKERMLCGLRARAAYGCHSIMAANSGQTHARTRKVPSGSEKTCEKPCQCHAYPEAVEHVRARAWSRAPVLEASLDTFMSVFEVGLAGAEEGVEVAQHVFAVPE